MKPHRLYIIMCIFSLLSFAGCRDEESVQSAESKRTITVNLGIAMSRVVLDDTDLGDDSQPTDMKVWIFNQDNTVKVDYYEISNPIFSGSDALGELVNTYERIIELENEVTALNFYVVLNSGNAQGLSPFLDENSMPDQIKAAFFTGLQNVTADNEVPAYGCEENFDVSDHKNSYSVPTINVTRTVGKLEVLFTKESEDSYLKINKVEITQGIPTKGYLAEVSDNDDRSYDEGSIMLFESEQEEEGVIDVFLPQSEANYGDFSLHADKFQSLTQGYLLENPNGKEWNDEKHDWTYPNVPDGETYCYVLQIDYQTLEGENPKSKNIYLPIIERNTWNKIFVRVKREEIDMEFELLVEPWHEIDIEVPPFV